MNSFLTWGISPNFRKPVLAFSGFLGSFGELIGQRNTIFSCQLCCFLALTDLVFEQDDGSNCRAALAGKKLNKKTVFFIESFPLINTDHQESQD